MEILKKIDRRRKEHGRTTWITGNDVQILVDDGEKMSKAIKYALNWNNAPIFSIKIEKILEGN